VLPLDVTSPPIIGKPYSSVEGKEKPGSHQKGNAGPNDIHSNRKKLQNFPGQRANSLTQHEKQRKGSSLLKLLNAFGLPTHRTSSNTRGECSVRSAGATKINDKENERV